MNAWSMYTIITTPVLELEVEKERDNGESQRNEHLHPLTHSFQKLVFARPFQVHAQRRSRRRKGRFRAARAQLASDHSRLSGPPGSSARARSRSDASPTP